MPRTKKKTELDLKKEQYLKLYKSWKKIYCPALQSNVLFTRWGWNHVIQKRGRTGAEQIKRLDKLTHVRKIILTTEKISEERKLKEYTTYRLEKIIDTTKIGVIIFKKKTTYYFVSVI